MSKFKDILKAAKEREADKEKVASPTFEPSAVDEVEPKTAPVRPQPQSETKAPKRGRPKGKRSDPDYEQVTAYIRKETYRQTKITLLQQEEVPDFSELIEKLLTEWLSTQKSKNSNT